MKIPQVTTDATLNVALDTLAHGKQALIFCSSKAASERQAEDIARCVKNVDLIALAEEAEHALPSPTKQCERLGKCVRRGIAFHHAGLHARQRELIEEEFRHGHIKIICCTPTLAAGLSLPAFRSIIKDLKRYGGRFGMQYIPVLEYLQMAGRAGRPEYDTYGESICIAKTEEQTTELWETYIEGKPEAIYSKLAVEPVLRTYTLSLIATGYVRTKSDILGFFSETFWAHHFKDMDELERIIDSVLVQLVAWEFLTSPSHGARDGFTSADQLVGDDYRATMLGKRVAELYVDPWTAHEFVEALGRSERVTLKLYSFLHLICTANELRPLLTAKNKEWDIINEKSGKEQPYLLVPEPPVYEVAFEDYLNAIKTASALEDWCDERDDEYLLEHYDMRPGETRAKIDRGIWLLHCLSELARLLGKQDLVKEINKANVRLEYGVREELLALLKIQGIGRVRARKLYAHKIKDIGDLTKMPLASLSQLLGPKIAASIKKQLGEDVKEVPEGKRLGQTSLKKYD